MNLYKAIEMLNMSGFKALPVPGTANYNVTFPNGQTTTLKEKQLLQLVRQANDGSGDIRSIVQQLSM